MDAWKTRSFERVRANIIKSRAVLANKESMGPKSGRSKVRDYRKHAEWTRK